MNITSNATPIVIKGLSAKETIETINRGYKSGLITKLAINSQSKQFIKDIRKGLKGTDYLLKTYGRNPYRKENGLSRVNGCLPLKDSTQISLFMAPKPRVIKKDEDLMV